MKLTRPIRPLPTMLFAAFVSTALTQLTAQTPTPTPPPPALPLINTQNLEVEFVEAHNLMAIPAQLQRKAGAFILVVSNRTQDQTAWFVVDPAPVAATGTAATASTSDTTAAVAPAHVLTIGSSQYEPKHRAGATFSATTGTYQLKDGATGAVLCTIVIE